METLTRCEPIKRKLPQDQERSRKREIVPTSVLNLFASKDTGINQDYYGYSLPLNVVMVGSPKTGKTTAATYFATDQESKFYMQFPNVYMIGNTGDKNTFIRKSVIPYSRTMDLCQ